MGGPSIIFDKSFLQSLSVDESMWLDHFFLSNITPLFYIETLADLEKSVAKGRTPESVVGNLAYKTPSLNSAFNAHHFRMIQGELCSAEVCMEYGRPNIPGGEVKELDGKKGVIFSESPEQAAFKRWTNNEFLQLEREHAKLWRRELSKIDLTEIHREFKSFFPISKPKTLDEVKKIVDFHLFQTDQKAVLQYGLNLLNIEPQIQAAAWNRWKKSQAATVQYFSPYFFHVLSVELFFNLGVASDLIGHGRPSHKVDIAYLYYLPFCRVFTSNDKLHIATVPFFLNDSQNFVAGNELKEEFAKLDIHYSKLPDTEKARGVVMFAKTPPKDQGSLVAELWDKHMNPRWRKRKEKVVQPVMESKFAEEMKRFENEGRKLPEGLKLKADEIEKALITKKVRGKKGKWTLFPPEVMNKEKTGS